MQARRLVARPAAVAKPERRARPRAPAQRPVEVQPQAVPRPRGELQRRGHPPLGPRTAALKMAASGAVEATAATSLIASRKTSRGCALGRAASLAGRRTALRP